jgi:PPOX class probable F420-dependent enzyme
LNGGAVIPETHRDILDKAGFAFAATIGPAGEPQCTPVWYDWDGNQLAFSTTRSRQKYRNLIRDPRIALTIADQDNPYHMIEVRGVVASIDDDQGTAFASRLMKRYTGQDEAPPDPPGEERVVVRVEPRHTTIM